MQVTRYQQPNLYRFNHIAAVYNRMKKKIFKLSRRIPFVREKIKTSLAEQKAGFERSMIKSVNGMPYIR